MTCDKSVKTECYCNFGNSFTPEESLSLSAVASKSKTLYQKGTWERLQKRSTVTTVAFSERETTESEVEADRMRPQPVELKAVGVDAAQQGNRSAKRRRGSGREGSQSYGGIRFK
ncbi:hypothetical protein F2P81_005294 [Scophthalmus maximus]|uniref:Uncharacterized protein n=1 Tax=Scophthalmus maximus TaxID=52904 RepID=A0A6A4TI64_SCOMX|nr:hypothetical protein F2P81_005294 [Scophthalmus maximus]